MIDTDGGHCGHCGKPLPDGVNLAQEYCDWKCRNDHNYARYKAERIEARKDRKCLWCGGAVPPEMNGNTIYCCRRCQDQSSGDMKLKRRRRARAKAVPPVFPRTTKPA